MPRSFTSEEMLELGTACYDKGQYQEAIDAFTKAISVCNDTSPVMILDRRAATYEKMNKLESALHDGKYMMKKDKSHPAGYLRSGKILQTMQKPVTALNIYEYGLRNVKPKDGCKRLRSAHDLLHREVYPPRPLNPFEIFPQELVLQVLGYLSYREIVVLLRVSRKWAKYLKANKSLWTHVDLFPLHGKLTRKAIMSCVYRSKGDLKKLEFHQSPSDHSWGMLIQICQYSDQLEELNFWDGKIFKDDIVRSIAKAVALRRLLFKSLSIPDTKVINILKVRPTLQQAKFYSITRSRIPNPIPDTRTCLPDLEHLVFCQRSADLRVNHSHELLPHVYFITPILKELRLHNVQIDSGFPLNKHLKELPLLEKLHLAYVKNLDQLVEVTPNLKCLGIWFIKKTTDFEINHQEALAGAQGLPNLEELELKALNYLDPTCIKRFVIGTNGNLLPRVTHYGPRYFKAMDHICQDDILKPLLAAKLFQNLNEVVLADGHVTDEFLSSLPDLLPQLQFISFRRLSITSLVLKQIVQKMDGRLKELCLDSCYNIAQDAVDWTKSQGVKVRMEGANNLSYT